MNPNWLDDIIAELWKPLEQLEAENRISAADAAQYLKQAPLTVEDQVEQILIQPSSKDNQRIDAIKKLIDEFDSCHDPRMKLFKCPLEQTWNPDEWRDGDWNTALIYAAVKWYFLFVRLLILAWADVNAINRFKKTALIWSTIMTNVNCVEVLIEHWADISKKDDLYQSAISYAEIWKNAWVFDFKDTMKLLAKEQERQSKLNLPYLNKIIADLGFDLQINNNLNERDEYWNTPLHYFVMHSSFDLATILIDSWADRTRVNFNWETPHDLALKIWNKQIIELTKF
ncbi:MAG: ankyrin repeat protein [uncultured bacterium (gcode 4)]|uniref:Ankyrin repeat protein n=1 Tax=uncultured bacterium (gcode 4) TaxID=1234023 RepID=K2G785_9BACT|nr:MAG: ankyrin repeat protein [uncultured bacterium (gcode 4)]